MGLAGLVLFSCLLPLLVLFFPSLSTSQRTFTSSRATFYGSPDCFGTPRGACGFGDFGKIINGGDVGAVAQLYRNGSGCGACYQIRCTNSHLCGEDGANIVVTDHGYGDDTDFILSGRGFAKLACRPNMAAELMAYGAIGIEYRRISCQYPGYNLMIKIKEHSNYPYYLALVFIYQAGEKNILAVELWQEDCQEWRRMRRAYGGVWDMENPPKGPMNLRFLASGDEGWQDWIQLNSVIPAYWKAGVAYDSAIQLY